jgi:hypothetical protein
MHVGNKTNKSKSVAIVFPETLEQAKQLEKEENTP